MSCASIFKKYVTVVVNYFENAIIATTSLKSKRQDLKSRMRTIYFELTLVLAFPSCEAYISLADQRV